MTGPKVAILDIETSPGLADVWKLWDCNVSLSQLREVTRVICFAAKWHGKPGVEFHSDHHDGHQSMVAAAHRIVDEADLVVHYNGTSFDMPHLHREFLLAGMDPPSPYKNVDLLRVVKRQFNFMSNKLDHVSQQLGLGQKTSHSGHNLWVQCLLGDEKAWNKMRAYNRHDVVLTEKLYDRLLPWVPNHPHAGLYTDDERPRCGRCGSTKLHKRGLAHAQRVSYQRYQCQGCGSWSRGNRIERRAGELRPV